MKIELFPCSGGMAEGFRRAGVTFDLAVDHDADACDSYELNHGHRPLQMDVNDLARMVRAGWRPTAARGRIPVDIDLLVADPPCTPWSRAGKREGLDDERDCLRVTAELIEMLRPRAYLIGNVPGLEDATHWHVVQEVIGGLARFGYCVADFVSLDAADFGVPQHRVRPFWFGHLEGPCIRWPTQTHADPRELGQFHMPGIVDHLKPWVTCRDALGHLPLEHLGRPVRMRIRAKGEDGTRHGGDDTRCSQTDAPARTVVTRRYRKGGQILLPNQKHPMSELDEPARTVTGSRANRGAQGGRALLIRQTEGHPLAQPDEPAPTIRGGGAGHAAPQVVLDVLEHPRHPISRADEPGFVVKSNGGRASGAGAMMRLEDPNRPPAAPDEPHRAISTARDQAVLEWPWNRPSTTVTNHQAIPPPGHHPESGSILSLPNAVVLSERAAAILQGFPDEWTFSGKTKRARWGQIGMAMPPALAAAVARAVAQQMAAALLASSRPR
ncbi:MAG: DNA cytosine methyltransferase [Pseudomonadota bacterium]